ncbi:MAG: metal dependent phosphohydrolase [Acidobacteria bacterium]|nr:metal dependent phosphohydrolase [Acidobacteriota bacterium]
MARLSKIKDLSPESSGSGFFLCARKEVRQAKNGEPFLALVLQDATGEIPAKVFGADAAQSRDQFEAGEFVAVEARANLYQGRTELILSRIRRVSPAQDRQHGFREEDCVPSAPRSIDEMWAELQARIAGVSDPAIRVLLSRIAADHEDRLRVWPAALTVHHAYRGGLLEHVLQIARNVEALGRAYDANLDMLFAGAVLHDIGKLRELDYDSVPVYSREGNLVGHIGIGLMTVRDAAAGISGLSDERRLEIEHLVASHHGSRELGSPVEPMTLEAFILAMADDLDAKVHQVRKHIATDENDGDFTSYHARLKRVLLKPSPTKPAADREG